MSSLDRLRPGECGRIDRIQGDSRIHQRLSEMGLIPGADVQVVRLAPMGDPMEVRVQGYSLSLRKAEAASVLLVPGP